MLRSNTGAEVSLLLRQSGPPYKVLTSKSVKVGNGWKLVEAIGVCQEVDLLEGTALFMLRVARPCVFDVAKASIEDLSPRGHPSGSALP
ncbi:MAG: hypothetical protein EOO38_26000 [Cytophagaceae bacterium]|nr:MAG: hypothetical protein EOO38_26000 [Cytophagaceae bacterium]